MNPQINDDALIELLENLGTRRVTLRFDGAGDSGSIESVELYDQENNEIPLKDSGLEDALYDLGYKVLDKYHISFDNEGEFGEIRIDLETLEIEVERNIRIISHETELASTSLDQLD